MNNAQQILVDRLHRLMAKKGWRKSDGSWDVAKLWDKTGGSKRYLYRVLEGNSDFSVRKYGDILWKAFGITLDAAIAPHRTEISPLPKDLEALLVEAIDDATVAGTIEALKYGISALANQAAIDRANYERLHEENPVKETAKARASPTKEKSAVRR